MGKIINTFKYGDKKVKIVLTLTILSGLGTMAFIVSAIVMSNMLFFFLALVCGFVTVSLVQTFMIEEEANPTVEGDRFHQEQSEKKPRKRTKKSSKKTSDKLVAYRADDTMQDAEMKNTEDSIEENTEDNTEENTEGNTEDNNVNGDKIEKHKEKNKRNKKEPKKEKIKKKTEEKNSSEPSVIEPVNEETVAKYNKKRIKKVMHKYKVKKDHRMVIIDRCEKLNINQTPAYIWVENNNFHILLIEKEPRHILVSLFRLTEITYLKKVLVDDKEDYKIFEKSTLVTDTFRPYLPDYLHNSSTTDLSSYKNLYGIGQGIYFTNNSAKHLFDLLGVEFLVDDKVTSSNKVNIFFKNCYKANIMLRDNVIDANGYADKVSKILDDMAHSTVSYAEFKDTLNLMIKNKLITQEFATYYMDVRDKISR